jgi:lysyl-tRNA synthetase class 1
MIVSRVIVRLRERGDQTSIESTIRVLAPLEFWTGKPKEGPWNSYFRPRLKAEDGREEYPCLAKMNPDDVEEWARLAQILNMAAVRTRFADAVWELGKKLGSPRGNLHRYGQLAAELYLELADANTTPQHSVQFLHILTRGISLSIQFRRPELIERGFRRMLGFAAAADQAHLGLWMAPFDRLIGLKGLSDSHRQEILEHHERRLNASIAARDLHQIMMAGGMLAKYFHDHSNYAREKEIALLCGEAVLGIAEGMNASLATHHIGNVLQWYRQAGLREDAERVRVLLESRAKAVLSEMTPQRFEFPVDREEIERAIVVLLDVPHPIVALYRLAEWWLPRPEGIKKLLDEGGLIVHRIMPTQIIGHMGLPVGMIGTDDEDQEGHIIMRMRDPMNLNAMVFLSGIEEWKKKFELGGLPETPNIFDGLLIPADRISLYREGLAAFDAHDYVKCIHVLVPQIENSLRELLKILGLSETKTDEQGAFDLKNMNDVLHEPLVRESLEEKLWFFLKALYVDKRGINLRNLIAHGIAPVAAFNRMNAGLVVQSVVLLSAIRPEAMQIAEDEAPEETSENSE